MAPGEVPARREQLLRWVLTNFAVAMDAAGEREA